MTNETYEQLILINSIKSPSSFSIGITPAHSIGYGLLRRLQSVQNAAVRLIIYALVSVTTFHHCYGNYTDFSSVSESLLKERRVGMGRKRGGNGSGGVKRGEVVGQYGKKGELRHLLNRTFTTAIW